MGVAIENSNALVKVVSEQGQQLTVAMKHDSLRISQVLSMQYGLSYIMATSSSGSDVTESGITPLDASVALNIEVRENPKTEVKYEVPQEVKPQKITQVGFTMSRDKFLQFASDMK